MMLLPLAMMMAGLELLPKNECIIKKNQPREVLTKV